MKCKECRDYNLCLHEANVFDQIFDPEYDKAICFKPITNADYIRSMSDEELASYLIENVWDCHLCSEHFRLDNEPLLRGELCDEKCVAHCLEWLKQPKEKEE